jgi:DNA-binding PadR family transcriptional regulator
MGMVNVSRLLVLGMLRGWGPMYGHQILRTAQRTNAELWSTVRIGSLYSALKRMEDEGLVRPVRVEREGALPERTVYEITAVGEAQFTELTRQALHDFELPVSDPFDMALTVTMDLDADNLMSVISHRRATIEERLDKIHDVLNDQKYERHLPTVGVAIVLHLQRRLEAELKWLDDLEIMTPDITEEMSSAHARPVPDEITDMRATPE